MNKYILGLFALVLLVGCSAKGPEPINYGSDECVHCKMTIMDNKFGAVILNKNGKSFKFDSAECMIDYSNENPEHSDSYFVTNFSKPTSLINAKEAVFLHGDNIKSPMGGNIAAFGTKPDATKVQQELQGDLLNWEELKALRKN